MGHSTGRQESVGLIKWQVAIPEGFGSNATDGVAVSWLRLRLYSSAEKEFLESRRRVFNDAVVNFLTVRRSMMRFGHNVFKVEVVDRMFALWDVCYVTVFASVGHFDQEILSAYPSGEAHCGRR